MNQFIHDRYNTPESQTRPSNVEVRVNIIDIAVRNACDILGSFLKSTVAVNSTAVSSNGGFNDISAEVGSTDKAVYSVAGYNKKLYPVDSTKQPSLGEIGITGMAEDARYKLNYLFGHQAVQPKTQDSQENDDGEENYAK